MLSPIYEIDNRFGLSLAVMPRSRAGDWLEGEVANWRQLGVARVISLLEPEEVRELGLTEEAALCRRHGIRFLSYPIPDRGLPPDRANMLSFALERTSEQGMTAIHCRAGIGRATMMVAAILICAGEKGEDALCAIEAARDVTVPDTKEQKEWILSLC